MEVIRSSYSGLHGSISQKMANCIIATVRTSNPLKEEKVLVLSDILPCDDSGSNRVLKNNVATSQ
jgi:hypothetical protein